MFDALFNASWRQYRIFGNTVEQVVLAFGLFLIFFILLAVFQKIILHRLTILAKKTKTDLDDTLISITRSFRPPFYLFAAFYVGFKSLTVPYFADRVVSSILVVWVAYQAVVALQLLIDYGVSKSMGGEKEVGAGEVTDLLSRISKGILWVVAALFVLSNLGVNVTSLVAGLGIGGIAVALALQNILGDLFSSFAIYFDKPFAVGDFIIIGDHMGVVEKIGIKTTRLRALQGEEIVISNTELTGARIQNFKKMKERRVVFSFGVTYDTPSNKLEKIPGVVKKIIESQEKTRFDRTHFTNFGDSSLDFEAVYYVVSPDFGAFRDIHQQINFAIKKAFEKEGISMAFPTRTVYLEK